MPELPEVEVVRRRLEPRLVGRTVARLEVRDATVSDRPAEELQRMVEGRTVAELRRRGKWLLFDLGAVVMTVHLRMTGRLLLQEDVGERPPRFVIEFDGGERLRFYDMRRFGRLNVVEADQLDRFLPELGPEPLSEEFTARRLRAALAGRRAPLKSVLIDQRRLAGVGNIYADEALFRAGLHPLREAGTVGPGEASRLRDAIVETLELGIAHEGTSVESFVDPAGNRGSFQEILNVYQRTGKPCRVCGTPVERTVVGGRGTHFCPRCQPRGRKRHTPHPPHKPRRA